VEPKYGWLAYDNVDIAGTLFYGCLKQLVDQNSGHGKTVVIKFTERAK
jgi:hypothetical protein